MNRIFIPPVGVDPCVYPETSWAITGDCPYNNGEIALGGHAGTAPTP
ncbi:MAG: hypothetical protein Q3M24_17385 [Candidatus Electrothrix aestuarii]|uniref:Uncharacterized protein n=1 Tax=Candidatus Electrothrix aestuarii TaxID=3062594 RepID=A0AAU8LT72_9BACT